MHVSPPDALTTQALAADWVEVMALLAGSGGFTNAELIGSLQLVDGSDHGITFDEGEPLEDEILDSRYEAYIEALLDEIQWRSAVLDDMYPFELLRTRGGWRLRRMRARQVANRVAQDCYAACLLMSAIRHGMATGRDLKPFEKTLADRFQRVCHLAAPALFGGESFWIAFPRPEGDDYGPAIARLLAALGAGELRHEAPPSQTSNKDGGIDLVAWRKFRDGRPGIILSYGQVASGKRWREKSVKNKLDSHYHHWLAPRPVSNTLPAMYIPFVQHELCRPAQRKTIEEVILDYALTLEAQLGLVLDRIRLAELTAVAVRGGHLREVDTGHYLEVQRWRVSLLKEMRR